MVDEKMLAKQDNKRGGTAAYQYAQNCSTSIPDMFSSISKEVSAPTQSAQSVLTFLAWFVKTQPTRNIQIYIPFVKKWALSLACVRACVCVYVCTRVCLPACLCLTQAVRHQINSTFECLVLMHVTVHKGIALYSLVWFHQYKQATSMKSKTEHRTEC